MEKLNLRTPKAYDYTAQSEKDEAKIFYYCISEGATEESYFRGIENHFPNIKQYPAEILLENKKNLRHQLFEDASVNKKYLEILVSKNAEGYSKGSKIKFEKFLPLIDDAIEQAKYYCEEPKKLVDELGTSVGKLMEEMRQANKEKGDK